VRLAPEIAECLLLAHRSDHERLDGAAHFVLGGEHGAFEFRDDLRDGDRRERRIVLERADHTHSLAEQVRCHRIAYGAQTTLRHVVKENAVQSVPQDVVRLQYIFRNLEDAGPAHEEHAPAEQVSKTLQVEAERAAL
jgi:hypothetical protein